MTSISDIAKKAGVAKSTVSRVINHHPHVSDETRQKVMALITELDYIPNQLARDLSRGKTQKNRCRHSPHAPSLFYTINKWPIRCC